MTKLTLNTIADVKRAMAQPGATIELIEAGKLGRDGETIQWPNHPSLGQRRQAIARSKDFYVLKENGDKLYGPEFSSCKANGDDTFTSNATYTYDAILKYRVHLV
jgi:hypothetical protein